MTSERREELGFEWLKQIIHEGWTATRTKNKYDRWDATLTKGDKVVYVENKIRDYNADNFKDEGAIVDEPKINKLYDLGNSFIIQYFPVSLEYYIWPVNDRDKWRKDMRWSRKNNQTYDKVLKSVYYLPMTDEYRRIIDFDISGYYEDEEKSI